MTREQKRAEIRRQAAERGVGIEPRPSGLIRLRGAGVDLLVRDLADVVPTDLKGEMGIILR